MAFQIVFLKEAIIRSISKITSDLWLQNALRGYYEDQGKYLKAQQGTQSSINSDVIRRFSRLKLVFLYLNQKRQAAAQKGNLADVADYDQLKKELLAYIPKSADLLHHDLSILWQRHFRKNIVHFPIISLVCQFILLGIFSHHGFYKGGVLRHLLYSEMIVLSILGFLIFGIISLEAANTAEIFSPSFLMGALALNGFLVFIINFKFSQDIYKHFLSPIRRNFIQEPNFYVENIEKIRQLGWLSQQYFLTTNDGCVLEALSLTKKTNCPMIVFTSPFYSAKELGSLIKIGEKTNSNIVLFFPRNASSQSATVHSSTQEVKQDFEALLKFLNAKGVPDHFITLVALSRLGLVLTPVFKQFYDENRFIKLFLINTPDSFKELINVLSKKEENNKQALFIFLIKKLIFTYYAIYVRYVSSQDSVSGILETMPLHSYAALTIRPNRKQRTEGFKEDNVIPYSCSVYSHLNRKKIKRSLRDFNALLNGRPSTQASDRIRRIIGEILLILKAGKVYASTYEGDIHTAPLDTLCSQAGSDATELLRFLAWFDPSSLLGCPSNLPKSLYFTDMKRLFLMSGQVTESCPLHQALQDLKEPSISFSR